MKFRETTPPRKRERPSLQYEWKVGDEAEHEWTDNDYKGCFHPIRFVSFDKKTHTATVAMLAFSEDHIIKGQEMSYFHPYRPSQPNHPYKVGEHIHFKMYGRKVRGVNVDGDVGARGEGVWVKGIVTEIDKGEEQLRILHVDWSSAKAESYTQTWVERRDMRPE